MTCSWRTTAWRSCPWHGPWWCLALLRSLLGEEIDAGLAEGYVLNDGPADDIVLDGSPACPLEGEDDVTPAGGRGMIHVTLPEDGKPGILPVDIQGSSDQILEGYWISEQNRDPWTILTWKVDLFIWNILKNMLILDLIIDKKLENYCLEIWVWY